MIVGYSDRVSDQSCHSVVFGTPALRAFGA